MTVNTTADTTPLKTIKEVKANSFIFEKPHALPLDICNEMVRRLQEQDLLRYTPYHGVLLQPDGLCEALAILRREAEPGGPTAVFSEMRNA